VEEGLEPAHYGRPRTAFAAEALDRGFAFSYPPKLSVVQNSYVPKHSLAKEQEAPRRQPASQTAKWGLLNVDEDAYASL